MKASEIMEILRNLNPDDEITIGFVDEYGDEIDTPRLTITSGIGNAKSYALCGRKAQEEGMDAKLYRWLRAQYAQGHETYLAEIITSEQELDDYIKQRLTRADST